MSACTFDTLADTLLACHDHGTSMPARRVGPRRPLAALRADNCPYHHGGTPEQRTPVSAELQERFRPDGREWERQVLTHGAALVNPALATLPGVEAA